MQYNATALLGVRLSQLGDTRTDDMIDHLSPYSPAIGASPTGHAEVVITFPAENLQQAIHTATAVLHLLQPIGLEVVPTEVWDQRSDLQPMPNMLSVSEAADILRVSRQAILQRIESGSLPATRIGSAWAIPEGQLSKKPTRSK